MFAKRDEAVHNSNPSSSERNLLKHSSSSLQNNNFESSQNNAMNQKQNTTPRHDMASVWLKSYSRNNKSGSNTNDVARRKPYNYYVQTSQTYQVRTSQVVDTPPI